MEVKILVRLSFKLLSAMFFEELISPSSKSGADSGLSRNVL